MKPIPGEMGMKKLTFLLALLISLPLSAVAEDFLYVMSARAKILSSPAFGSKTVDNLLKGQKITNLEKKANWYKVKHNGLVGWVSRLAVSNHPPMKRSRRMANADSKLMNNSRRRASTVSTTAAVRGLKNMDRSRVNNKDVMDYAALDRVESKTVEQDELYTFMDSIGK